MNYKEFKVNYKDDGNGMIEGYASTWIKKPDSYGDIVKQGAFAKTLAERWNGGEGIPLLWAHQMDTLTSYIGTAKAEEDEKGLHFVAGFDDTEEAQRVRDLYKDGRLSKFSFAFDIKDQGKVTLEDGIKANELRELDLYEISCVCVPANDDAGVVGVKEAEDKSGRRNRKSDEDTIKEIINLANSLLDSEVVDDTEEPEPEATEEPEANEASEEQKGAIVAEKERLLQFINSIDMEE